MNFCRDLLCHRGGLQCYRGGLCHRGGLPCTLHRGDLCHRGGPPCAEEACHAQMRHSVSQRRPAVWRGGPLCMYRGGLPCTYRWGPPCADEALRVERRPSVCRGGPLCTEEARCAQRRPAMYRGGPLCTEEARRAQRRSALYRGGPPCTRRPSGRPIGGSDGDLGPMETVTVQWSLSTPVLGYFCRKSSRWLRLTV